MNTIERIEKLIIALTALTCVTIPILDFLGALESFSWLSNRVHLMTMLAIGVIALFLMVTLKRMEERSEFHTSRIVDTIKSDETDQTIIGTIKGFWDERESDIYRLFDRISLGSESWSVKYLLMFLDDSFFEITNGHFGETRLPNPWDFTLTAIDFDGKFIYHPKRSKRSTRAANSYPYSEIFTRRSGTMVTIDADASEQMRLVKDDRLSGMRLTKFYFREFVKLNAIVIFESHINIINQIEKLDLTDYYKPSYDSIGLDKDALSSSKLEIIEASYGTTRNRIDVTKELNQSIVENKLNIKVSNDIGGDPDQGRRKILTIKYRLDDWIFVSKFREYQQVNLP